MNVIPSHVKCKPATIFAVDDMSEQQLLYDVYQFYSTKLIDELDIISYVCERGFNDDTIETFQLGYTNRMLCQLLKDSPSLRQERGRLKRLGLVNPSTGHELLNGCITLPVITSGRIVGGYGRRARPTIRAGSTVRPYHLLDESALFNEDCLLNKPKEVLLCKSPLEAISVIQMGFEAVLGFVGSHDFTVAHANTLKQAGVKTVIVLFNLNEYFQLKLLTIATLLNATGIQCQCVDVAGFVDVNHILARFDNGKDIVHRLINHAEKVSGNGI